MTTSTKSIHQFKVNDIKGQPVDLADYEGKVLLIVNTASKCGFTPQLKSMEELYQEYKDQGLEILAFPSNDFAGQEPLNGEEIESFCTLNYQSSFPLFEKVHVKGQESCDLYQFLADKKQNGQINSVPKWNFHKYLVDKEGKVIDYFLCNHFSDFLESEKSNREITVNIALEMTFGLKSNCSVISKFC